MHELSIALSMLDLVEEELERQNGGRAVAIHLKLGPLSGVLKEALISAFGLAREGTPFEHCELKIEEVPLVVFCPECQAERKAVSVQELCCSNCGTITPQIITGKEMEVTALEITS